MTDAAKSPLDTTPHKPDIVEQLLSEARSEVQSAQRDIWRKRLRSKVELVGQAKLAARRLELELDDLMHQCREELS